MATQAFSKLVGDKTVAYLETEQGKDDYNNLFPDHNDQCVHLKASKYLGAYQSSRRGGKWAELCTKLGISQEYELKKKNCGNNVGTAMKQLKQHADFVAQTLPQQQPPTSNNDISAGTGAPAAAVVGDNVSTTDIVATGAPAAAVVGDNVTDFVAITPSMRGRPSSPGVSLRPSSPGVSLSTFRTILRDERDTQLQLTREMMETNRDTQLQLTREMMETNQKNFIDLGVGLKSVNRRVDDLADDFATKGTDIKNLRQDVDYLLTAEKGRQSSESKKNVVQPRELFVDEDNGDDTDARSRNGSPQVQAEGGNKLLLAVKDKHCGSSDDSINDKLLEGVVDAPKNVSSKKWKIVCVAVFSMVALVAVPFFLPEATSSVTTYHLPDMFIAFKEAISHYSSFLASDEGDAIPDYSPSF